MNDYIEKRVVTFIIDEGLAEVGDAALREDGGDLVVGRHGLALVAFRM